MTTELHIILFIPAALFLWMAGGTIWKGWRRIILPLCVIAFVATSHSLLTAVLSGLLTALVASLPYGDRTPVPIKFLVFCSYGLPAVLVASHMEWDFSLIRLSIVPIVPLCGGLLLALERSTKRWNFVTHKVFEAGCGFALAASLSVGVMIP